MMMTRGEGADEEEDGAGGVLRASGAGAKNTEGKDGNDDDEVGEKGDAGGVLRAFGADKKVTTAKRPKKPTTIADKIVESIRTCLLYTSDAADE